MSAKPTCLIVASAAPQGQSANLIHHFEGLCSDKYTVFHGLKRFRAFAWIGLINLLLDISG